MDISISITSQDLTVTLNGALLFSAHQQFRPVLTEHLKREEIPPRVVIDLSRTSQIDSAGLGMLLLARQGALDRQRKLVLRGAHGQVQRMLAVSKFETLFSIEA